MNLKFCFIIYFPFSDRMNFYLNTLNKPKVLYVKSFRLFCSTELVSNDVRDPTDLHFQHIFFLLFNYQLYYNDLIYKPSVLSGCFILYTHFEEVSETVTFSKIFRVKF